MFFVLYNTNILKQKTQLQEVRKMLAYIEAIERKDTITIDGYTSAKTERGIIADVARAVEKYDKGEAEGLRSCLANGLDKYNHPFVKSENSDGGYFFEYEEVSCASCWNEEKEEMEYKEGYYHYFCIRIVK